MINNAGNSLPLKRFEEITDEDWDAIMMPTLGGMRNMVQAVLQLIATALARPHGSFRC